MLNSSKLLESVITKLRTITFIRQYISNKMQRHIAHLYLEAVLHVSGGISTHHQEHTHTCIYSIWYLSDRYCYLPLSWGSWELRSISSTIAANIAHKSCYISTVVK